MKEILDFKKIADTTYDWEYLMDFEGNIIYCSPSCFRITGYTPDEFYSNPRLISNIVHPDDKNIFQPELKLKKKEGYLSEIEFRIVKKDATVCWIGHVCQPIFREDGSFIGLRGSNRDNTSKKNLQTQRDEKEKLRKTLYETSIDGFWITDHNGKLLEVNNAYEKMSGYSREELLTLSIMDIEAKESSEETAAHIEKTISKGWDRFESRHRRKNGTEYSVEISTTFIPGEEGKFVCFIRDITNEKFERDMLLARLRVNDFAETHTLDELLQYTLDETESFTRSKIGFYHFVDDDQETLHLQMWSTNTINTMCTTEGKGSHYSISQAGVWVDCVHKREPVIHNDYQSLLHKKGYPEGHAPITRELVVPVLRGGKIQAILGVGNKATDYTLEDVRTVSTFADLVWDIVQRKKAIDELAKSQKHYYDLFNQSPVMIWEEDFSDVKKYIDSLKKNGIQDFKKYFELNPAEIKKCASLIKICDASRESLQFFGIDSKDALILKLPEFFIEESWPVFVNEVAAFAKGQLKFDGEIVIQDLEGNKKQLLIRISIGLGSEESWERVLFAFQDISELRLTEQILRGSEQRYKNLFEESKDAIVIFELYPDGTPGKIIQVNKIATETFGYSKIELINLSASDLEANYSKELISSRIESIKQKGKVSFETKLKHKDGRLITVEVLVYPALMDGREYLVNIIRDITERKLVEERLKKSEEKYRLLLEHSGQGIGLYDLEGRVLLFNKIAVQNLGGKAEDYVGKSLGEIFGEEAGSDYLKRIKLAAESETSIEFEDCVKISTGEYWFLSTHARFYNAQGEVEGVQVISHNITDRKNSVEHIRESEEKYRTLFNGMAEGAFYQNKDGRLIDVNQAALDLFDITREDFLSRTSFSQEWKVVDENGNLINSYNHSSVIALRTGEPVLNKIVGVYNGKVEDYKWMSVNAIPQFRVGEDSPYQVFVTLHDLTEIKQMELSLKKSEEKYRLITERSNELICIHDLDGTYTYISPSVEKILGYLPEELWGTDPYNLFHPDDKKRILEESHKPSIEGKEYINVEYRIRKKDGSYIWFETLTDLVKDKNGKVIGLQTASKDISQRKAIDEKLSENEEKLRSIFNTLSEGVALNEIVYDDQGEMIDYRILEVNSAFYSLADTTSDNVIGNLASNLYQLSPEFIKAFWKNHKDKTETQHTELFSPLSNKWFYVSTSPFQNNKFLTSFIDITERKQLEAARIASEEKYRKLFTEMRSGFSLNQMIFSPEGEPIDYITLEVNDSFESFLDVKRDLIIGKKASEFLPQPELKHWLSIFGPVVSTGKSTSYEMYSPSNNKYFDGNAYQPEEGKFAAVFVDVTERKLLEEARIASEEKYRLLFENSLDGILYSEPDGKIFAANKAACQILQMTEEEICRVERGGVADYTDPCLIPALKERKEKGYFFGELSFKRGNGEKFPVELTSSIFSDKNGNERSNIIFRDISDRKRNEEIINTMNERLMLAQRASNAGAWDWNIVQNTFFWSQEFLHLFGLPADTVPGFETWKSVLHPDDVDEAGKKIAEAIEKKIELMNEYRIILPDGKIKWIRAIGDTIYADGKPSRMAGLCIDITSEKNTEEKILSYSTTLSSIFENTPYIMLLVDEEGSVININHAGEEFAHSTKDKLLGHLGGEVFHCLNSLKEPGCGRNSNCSNCPIRSRVSYTFQTKLAVNNAEGKMSFRFNGDILEYELLITTTLVKQDEKDVVLLTLIDLTERKKAEELLRQSEAKYRTIFETAAEGILVADINEKIITANNQMAAMLGYSTNELIEKKYLDFISPEELEDHSSQRQNRLAGQGNIYERRLIKKDGSTIWCLVSASPVYDNNGNYAGAFGMFTDITERKFASEALRKSEALFKSFVDNSSDLTTLSDMDDNLLFISPQSERVLGYSGEDYLGSQLRYKIHPEDREAGIEKWKALKMFNKEIRDYEYRLLDEDGTVRWISHTAKQVTVEGNILGIQSTIKNITERKLSEKALIESEEKYRMFFEADLAGDFKSTVDGTLLDCNQAFLNMLEFNSKEQALSTDMHSIYPTAQHRDEIYNELKQNGSLELIETELVTMKGKPIVVLESLIAEYDADGSVYGATGFMIDLTQIKIADKAIKESERKYRQLFYHMHNGFAYHEIILDEAGKPVDYRFLDVNPGFENMTGLNKEKILGKTVLEVLPGTEKHWIDSYGTVALTQRSKNFESFSREIGRYFKVHAYSPEKLKFAVLVEDVTELRKTEEKIRQLSIAVDQSPVSIGIINIEGSLIYVNPSFCKSTGYPEIELLGKNPTILNSGLMTHSEYEEIWRDLNSGNDWSGVFQNKKKNGELYWESANISPIRDSYGKITHYIVIKEDITEKVNSERELEQYRNHLESTVKLRTFELAEANSLLKEEIRKEKEYEMMLQQSLSKEIELNELKTRFISTASHEFRTPLTSISLSAGLIQRYGKKWSEEKFTEHVNRINGSIKYLTKLLDDVLTISRTESGKIVFEPSSVELKSFCQELMTEISGYITEKHNLSFKYGLHRKHFMLDEKLLKFMLSNMLSNAFKYSPQGGTVSFNVSSSKSNLIFVISDEGIGIPEADRNHVFEPFHRSKNSIDIQGTGLGLSIVKRAVDLHNGEIWFTSELNKGTTFTIKIPRVTAEKNAK